MTTRYAVSLFTFGLLLSGSSVAGNSIDILWAVTDVPATIGNHMDSIAQPQEPYINRIGSVAFNADLFLPRSAETSQRTATSTSFRSNQFNLFFFPGQSFSIVVDSESRPNPNTLLIGGHLYNSDFSTFSLTITPESYLINLQVPGAATVYRVVGNTQTGDGRVTEIDLHKMPPILDGPSPIPPQD